VPEYDLGAPDRPRALLLMPSWQPDGDIGVKIVTVFPDNADRGLPSVNAAYVLLSGQTGQPRVSIDGRALTLIRTAAVSALAADLLAPAAPEVLLMVGTGASVALLRRRPSGRSASIEPFSSGAEIPTRPTPWFGISALGMARDGGSRSGGSRAIRGCHQLRHPGAATAHPGPLAQIPMSLGFGRQLQAQHERGRR